MGSDLAFAEASSFLAPVLNGGTGSKPKGSSVIDCLALNNSLKQKDDFDTRYSVIQKALDLLSKIRLSFESEAASTALENLSDRKTLDVLLDLISLEGIYPCLSPGVGIPIERRVKSILRAGFVTKSSPSTGRLRRGHKKLLPAICINLYEIAIGHPLSSVLRDRTLVDLIAGLGELAYSPLTHHEAIDDTWTPKLNRLLDKTPAFSLLPILASLLHPATPTWFRSPLATSRSLLPLRPEGVRNTIKFIASAMSPAPHNPENSSNRPGDTSFGPSLSLEVLNQSSKLLSSIPSSLDADTYYSALAPQLLKLLDDSNIDTKRVASYIISNGILGRRLYGAPGSIGWTLFAQSIIECFNPDVTQDQAESVLEADGELPSIIISEDSLQLGLERLASLVLLHPNPGLTKRLISPCWRQIWGLLCYSKEAKQPAVFRKLRVILAIYFKNSVGLDQLICLSDGLLWEGDLMWVYYTGLLGRAGIRTRQGDSAKQYDMVAMMHDIDSRVDEFLLLLRSGVANDEEIGMIFTHTSKHWLLNGEIEDGNPRLEGGGTTKNEPLYSLMYAKLTQMILENYKERLAANPKRIFELVNQLLTAFIANHAEARNRAKGPLNPSLAGLEDIANLAVGHTSNKNDSIPIQEDSAEVVSVSLSFVSAIISSPEFFLNQENYSLLETLRGNLAHCASPKSRLPASLSMTATNIIALLNLNASPASDLETTVKPADPYVEDRKTHSLALIYLSDPLPPIRAQGLSLLTSLISNLSPILDIPSTSVLLQSLLQDDDEFIYLSTIKSLGLLASQHSKTVVRMLLEQYIDVNENSTLDVRIRTGEALLKTIESLGKALVGEVATSIAETMITVAGRRSQKPKNKESRKQEILHEANLQREAEEAWEGPVPSLFPPESSSSSSPQSQPTTKQTPPAPPTLEDDPLIRASALSILGTSIDTNIASLPHPLITTTFHLALSILTLEPQPDKSMVRRAAVLVIGSLFTAFSEDEDGDGVGVGLGEGLDGDILGLGVGKVMGVLRGVGDGDCDEVVKGHVGVVIEGLEKWGSRRSRGGEIRFGLGKGRLLGLEVDPEASAGKKNQGIVEVLE